MSRRFLWFVIFLLTATGSIALATSERHGAPVKATDAIGRSTYAVPCEVEELSSVSNGGNKRAELRRSVCAIGPLKGQDSLSYFVFVRRGNEPKSARNLVLRYDLPYPDRGFDSPPVLSWAYGAQLNIDANNVGTIARQRANIEGVAISYNLNRLWCIFGFCP